jgi:hypothetical protein
MCCARRRNVGPAAARNIAIAASARRSSRFSMPMTCSCRDGSGVLTHPGWDLIADNIAFVPDTADLAQPAVGRCRDAGLSALDLAGSCAATCPRTGPAGGAWVSQTPDPAGFP